MQVMASLTTPQTFCNFLSPKVCSKSSKSFVAHLPLSVSPHKTSHKMKFKYLGKASSQELPDELIEDSKFVPLNAEDPIFGPPALLLSGFKMEELAKVQRLLKELEGEFLKIIVCTEDMINGSLWDAVNTKQSSPEDVKVAISLPRICFLSGLTGEEMLMFIDAFPEFGIDPPVFAALVPNSADKPLKDVMEEIMGDHEMMAVGLESRLLGQVPEVEVPDGLNIVHCALRNACFLFHFEVRHLEKKPYLPIF